MDRGLASTTGGVNRTEATAVARARVVEWAGTPTVNRGLASTTGGVDRGLASTTGGANRTEATAVARATVVEWAGETEDLGG